MAVTLDILRAWRDPRGLMREKLGQGGREDRAFAVLMAACGLIYVSQWPRLSREALANPDIPLEARMGGALMGTLFLLPLLLYALAAASHLAARLVGGRGGWHGARLALFWSLLAISPAMLLNGLAIGFLGQGTQTLILGGIIALGFVYLWLSMLIEAERKPTWT